MFVSVMCTVQLYMYEILFVLPQVDCWYVVVNRYLRYCRENEPEKSAITFGRKVTIYGNVLM